MIKTDRLTLKSIKKENWTDLQKLWRDFSLSQYAIYDSPHPTDDISVKNKAELWENAQNDVSHFFYGVYLDDTFIGYVAAHTRVKGFELSYCFLSAFQGKGYAKESLTAVIDRLSSWGEKSFVVRTALNNTPSVKLLNSLNFKLVGTENVSFYKDLKGQDVFFDGGIYQLCLS